MSILREREATIGRAIDLDKPVILPKPFKDVLSKSGENSLLLVCDPNKNCVRMFPVSASRRILKFSLQLRELAPTFLQELRAILAKNRVKTLYSSGICLRGGDCYYEGYIDEQEYISLEDFKVDLKNISGLFKVSIEFVM